MPPKNVPPKIRAADPREPGATRLLEASHALMRSLFAADECHFLEIDALCMPTIHFFVVELQGETVGCGAIAEKDGYGEIKSMFVDPDARGQGVAALVMQQLEDTARGLGLPWLKLETGNVLYSAHRLYERFGFETCAPFGDYIEHPASVYYAKRLT